MNRSSVRFRQAAPSRHVPRRTALAHQRPGAATSSSRCPSVEGRLARVTDDDAATTLDIPPGAFVEYLGLDLREVSGDRVVATWTAGPRHHQPFGIVHGGVHCSVVETLGSFGATYWLLARDPQGSAVGVNNSTDFFRAVTEGPMTSTG